MRAILFSILAIGFAILCLGTGIQHVRENAAFRARGVEAEILSINNTKRHDTYKRKRGSTESTYTGSSYTGEVVFETKEGETVTVPPKSLPPRIADQVAGGASVPIWYVSDKPTWIRFQDKEEHGWAEVAFGLLIGFWGVYSFRRAMASND